VRVETFSNKSRDFTGWSDKQILAQVRADANEARLKYGGIVQVRRPDHPLFGQDVPVSRVHLVYDARNLTLQLKNQMAREVRNQGVEVHFHHAP
jgi:hypothetical protein